MACVTGETFTWSEENETCSSTTYAIDPRNSQPSIELNVDDSLLAYACCKSGAINEDVNLLMACENDSTAIWDDSQ